MHGCSAGCVGALLGVWVQCCVWTVLRVGAAVNVAAVVGMGVVLNAWVQCWVCGCSAGKCSVLIVQQSLAVCS